MKVRRRKNAKRTINFYRRAFGIEEPYRILIDGTFLHAALKHKVYVKEELPKLLGGKCTPVITSCVLAEMRHLGSDLLGAVLIAKNFYRLKCDHSNSSALFSSSYSSASSSLSSFLHNDVCSEKENKELEEQNVKSLVKERNQCNAVECILQTLCARNQKVKYLVASEDKQLKEAIRKMAGVPLIFLMNNVPMIEEPSKASYQKYKQIEEAKLAPREWEKKFLTESQKNETEIQKKKRKRKGGPNPLSCLKKKVRPLRIAEKTESVKKKRQRKKRKVSTAENVKQNNEIEKN